MDEECLLNKINNNVIFNECINTIKTVDTSTFSQIVNTYYKYNRPIMQLLGLLKRYYIDGYSIADYYQNIITTVGNGNTEKGFKLFMLEIYAIVDNISNELTDVDKNTIQNVILTQLLYESYVGFWYETYIKQLLSSRGFEVYSTDELDFNYKIDILIKKDNNTLGLQLKSDSFLSVSNKTKNKYTKANSNAVKDNICTDVLFLLHNNNGQTVNVIKYTNLDGFIKMNSILTDDDIISQIL